MITLKTNLKSVSKIVHFSDVHVRILARHQEYREVFEKLYKSINEVKNNSTIIVICGDIMHSKLDMSPELIMLSSEFFTKLSEICPLVIIPGNHDLQLNNKNRLDALSPIISNLKNERIYYLKEGGVYKFANITLVHMSIFDEPENYIKAKDINSNIKIALFHGVVSQAKNNFGYIFSNEKININTFKDFDITLLGDIHLVQDLSKNIKYSGSLIAQSHAETNKHGYVLWDLNKKISEFIEIENDYGFHTIEIKNNIIPDLKEISKKPRLRLNIYNSDNTKINEIISEIKQKYSPIELTINKIYDSKNANKDTVDKINVNDLQNVEYQNELIEEFLNKKYKLNNGTISKIKQLNIELNKEITQEEVIRNVRWKPIKFKWSNMFSYGKDNIIDFEKFKGTIGVWGQNALGKSSILSSLSYCLFDKTNIEYSSANIMNNRCDDFNCKFEFELDNFRYFIEKSAKRSKKGDVSCKVDFWSEDEIDKTSLNGEKRSDTIKNIANKIGTFEDFILTSYSTQIKNMSFSDIGHSKRKDLIIQFAGLSVFDKLYDLGNDKLKVLNNQIKQLQKENWNFKLNEAREKLKILEKEYREILDKEKLNKNEYEKILKKINNLKKQIEGIDENLDIDELNNNKEKLNSKIFKENEVINNIIKKIEIIQIKISETRNSLTIFHTMNVEKLYEEYNNIIEEINNLDNEIEKISIIVENKLDKMDKLGKLEYDKNCNYCMNNIFVKDAIRTKDELEKDQNSLNELKSKKDYLLDIVKSKKNIKEQYSEFENIKQELEEIISSSEVNINELSNRQNNYKSIKEQLSQVENDIEKYKNNKIKIENNIRTNSKIQQLEIESKNIKEIVDELSNNKLIKYGNIQVCETNIKTYQKSYNELNKLQNDIDYYEKYLEATNRNGLVYNIILKLMPRLESEINNILSQICDFSVLIVPDDKNINMFLVYDENRRYDLSLASGMEKFISSIAIRVALINISNLSRPDILFIDEGFGTLDTENLNSMSILFDYLKTQFETIFIISHIDQLKDISDMTIDITKENDFSYIK